MLKLYDLDEKIKVAGTLTTIREQAQIQKVKPVTREDKSEKSAGAKNFWAEIEKPDSNSEGFRISEATFRFLEDKTT